MNIGIPTEYGGVRFRSRLEARWAAFFDLLRWPWEYEPIDLRGYIPDFALTFPRAPMLVEVKSELGIDWWALRAKHADRIEAAVGRWADDDETLVLDWGDGETLIVGAVLGVTDGCGPNFGAICDPRRGWWDWGPAVLTRCQPCKMWTPIHDEKHNDQGCRFCGNWPEPMLASEHRLLRELWDDAGNTVQWKRPSTQPTSGSDREAS